MSLTTFKVLSLYDRLLLTYVHASDTLAGLWCPRSSHILRPSRGAMLDCLSTLIESLQVDVRLYWHNSGVLSTMNRSKSHFISPPSIQGKEGCMYSSQYVVIHFTELDRVEPSRAAWAQPGWCSWRTPWGCHSRSIFFLASIRQVFKILAYWLLLRCSR